MGFEPTIFGSLHPSGVGARCPILAVLTTVALRDLDYGPVQRRFLLTVIKLVIDPLGYALAIRISAILLNALLESVSTVVNFWPERFWAPLP